VPSSTLLTVLDQAGRAKHRQVLGDCVQRHVKRPSQLRDRSLATS
jgi:hypothetical protein